MIEVDPLKHPICFSDPFRVAMSAWMGHVPFAMYLVDVLRPKAIAELGTHNGVSYCAFCQAVKELRLETRCYAIDTWEGDAQAGFYGSEVLADLETHHNPRYGEFSRLIKSTFDEASTYFAEGTFDLLHLDGLHTYEAVKKDFDTWLPKMSEHGVVLFHDINVRERDFGVWKLWSELKLNYRSFEFVHSHGLGVLALGRDYPEEFEALLRCSEPEALAIRRFFASLGSRLEILQEYQNVKPELERLKVHVQEATQHITGLTAQLHEHETMLDPLEQKLKRKDFQLRSMNWQLRHWQLRERQIAQMQRTTEAVSQTFLYRLVRAMSSPRVVIRRRFIAPLSDKLARISPRFGLRRSSGGALTRSSSEAKLISKLFDAEWYLLQNEDVARAGVDPLEHYLNAGAIEGRAPHPLFDPKFYLKTYPEAALSGLNPLQHYLTHGSEKGFRPNPRFDPSFYRSTYRDIAEAGVEPLTHFIVTGLREGRVTCPEDIKLESFEGEFDIPSEPLADPEPFESDIKAIAFFLPQFHPIPENDEWWGAGFTEWTNVKRGQPQFKDHYQPHIPYGLNYYDLREEKVLENQVKLARDYGLHGFCFYYYWFAGKILLDLPIRRMLETGKPDFPFCICWANENWTRRWDGREKEILAAQRHSPEDDLAFIKNVEPYLLHNNYIRVEGKPLLIVYQPSFLPDARATAARWRDYFNEQGHGEIFLAAMQTFAYRNPPDEYGFDAVIQFPPHCNSLAVNACVEEISKSFSGFIYDYNQTKWGFIDELSELSSSRRIYPGVMPSWDNTARLRSRSSIWINSSPESYYDWLRQAINFLRNSKQHEEKLLFINAWNEWSEGCHLEPDQLFGYAWLNATRLALEPERVEDQTLETVATSF